MKTTLICFVLFASTGAFASSKSELLARLGTIDTPLTQPQLEELVGPQLPEFLREIASDAQAYPLHRQRAAAMLEWYPSEASKQTLLKATEDEYGPVRKAAVLGLVKYLGDRQVETKLLKALEDESVVVRKAAIRSVAQLPSARQQLQRRQALEKDAQTLRLLTESLK